MIRKFVHLLLALALLVPSVASAERTGSMINTIEGEGDNMPQRYSLPLISNGSICLHLDEQASHNRVNTNDYLSSILWQGRRTGVPNDKLFPFGFLRQEIVAEGKTYIVSSKWKQAIDAQRAMMICENSYNCGLDIKSEVFAYADADILVIRKTFSAPKGLSAPVTYKLKYDQSAEIGSFVSPRRMTFSPVWNDGSIDIGYKAYGLKDYEGVISFITSADAERNLSLEDLSYSVKVEPVPGKPVTVDFFLCFSDNVYNKSFEDECSRYKQMVTSLGFDGLLSSHAETWAERWGKSSIEIPDEQLERAYAGGKYMLISNATRWSFPVGIGLWEGRYFGFDETCCYLGLASSNLLDISRRAPEFRKSLLKRAVSRTKDTGCRWVWETMEDGTEGTPTGFWEDHVFHMSHVATAAWTQFQFTNDLEYLRNTAYPILLESSRFFKFHQLYTHPDGSVTFGKCTDLERLGPGIENPFFSSCGAIFTFECTVEAAKILGIEDEQTASFAEAASALRKTLPNNGEMYVPYLGCKENSVAVTTGMYPYPVLSTDDKLERAAIDHFYEERYSAGNMYKMGSGLCPWYASWIASALSNYGERTKSLKLLKEAASQIGYFAEHFEINEAEVVMRPWFTTAAGNYVNALNQTLLLNRADEVFVCYSAPVEWKDYSFTLPCYGNMLCTVEVRNGQISKCLFTVNDTKLPCVEKTIHIPAYLINEKNLAKASKGMAIKENGLYSFKLDLQDGGSFNLMK